MASLDDVFGGIEPGFAYSRHGNPTTRELELAVAALEETEEAVAFASGMAALHAALLSCVKPESRVVASSDLYGASLHQLETIFGSLGVETELVDMADLALLEQTVERIRPRAILCETLSNPLLKVANLEAIAAIGKQHRTTVICDNTFASPILVNPARFGIDIVVHSTTKYLGGHGDVTGGVIATSADRAFEIVELTKLVGGIPGPFESWLTLRGIRTLPLRVRQQSVSAARIAQFLNEDPRIARVYYPGMQKNGLPAIFNDDLRGGMISFELANGTRQNVFAFMDALQLFLAATSLGDVYSLALYPPISSHRGIAPEDLTAVGISEGLVRISVGIEDVDDLIADLDQALPAI